MSIKTMKDVQSTVGSAVDDGTDTAGTSRPHDPPRQAESQQDTVDTSPPRNKELWNPQKFVEFYNEAAQNAQLPGFRGDAQRLDYIGRSLYPSSRALKIAEFAEEMRDYDLANI